MLNKATALEKLRRQLSAIDHVPPSTSSSEFKKWKRDTEVAIENVFGEQTRHAKEFANISYSLLMISNRTPDSAWTEACRRGLDHAKVMLQSMIDEIEEYRQDERPSNVADEEMNVGKALVEGLQGANADLKPASSDIFVVHGHDVEMKQSVCRTLEQLGLKPIVLHEQPSRGRTIIEKFTDYATVGFAVVLLSPDDVGCERKKAPDGLRPRARQNVVLELGFFFGKLGRSHVMALSREVNNFELPSDYSGVIFTPFDAFGHWRFELVKELKAAGYDVDSNRLL